MSSRSGLTLALFVAAGLGSPHLAGSGCSVVRTSTSHNGRLLLLGTALTSQGVIDARILVNNGTIASVLPSHEHEHSGWADLVNDIDDHLTVVRCGPDAVISPGFINTHEHIEFSTVRPLADIGERVDHRHDWRVGLRGYTARPAPVNETAGTEQDATRWGELRHLLSGTTSIIGGQMVSGLVRNLDYADGLEQPLRSWLHECKDGEDDSAVVESDLAAQVATWDTFPLGDAQGIIRIGDCDYSTSMVDGAAVARMHRYLPHVAEGVDDAAVNEFKCLSNSSFDKVSFSPGAAISINIQKERRDDTQLPADMAKADESTAQPPGHLKPPRPVTQTPGTSSDILGPNIGLVHALGVPVSDYPLLAAKGVSVIWSPRSNVFLYGKTLDIHALLDAGINVALGTDWLPSGSASMTREAACARDISTIKPISKSTVATDAGTSLNEKQRGLQARTIWQMMTTNAAHVAGMDGKIGTLKAGAAADIIIVASSPTTPSKGRGLGDAGREASGGGDDESYYAKAIYAEPASVQLVLRGGTPLVIDTSLQDLVPASSLSSSRCEQIPYSSVVSKILCLGHASEEQEEEEWYHYRHAVETVAGKPMSYAQLIRDHHAAGVYPAFYPPGEIPEDEPSCVSTR